MCASDLPLLSPCSVTNTILLRLERQYKTRRASAIIRALHSGWLRSSCYLALDLLPEFQRMLDFFEHFGCASCASHGHRSVAQNSSHGRFIDHDALDSGEEDFRGPAIREAGLYNDPLVGDGHLRDVALQQTNAKEGRSDEEANKNDPIHRTARGHSFGSCRPGKRGDEKCYREQLEHRSDGKMPQHHNPMELGLILNGLTRNEMLFDVAQGGSLPTAAAKGPGALRRIMTPNGTGP